MTTKESNSKYHDLLVEVYELAGIFRAHGETIARQEGQTQARWQMLSVISDAPKNISQSARRLGITRQSAQRTAHELVNSGMARWKENPDHKRAPLLALMEEGTRALSRMTKRANLDHKIIEQRVPPKELEKARKILIQVKQTVREIDQK